VCWYLLFAVWCAFAQELPTVRLMDSLFVGIDAPSLSYRPSEWRIAVHADGTRFTIHNWPFTDPTRLYMSTNRADVWKISTAGTVSLMQRFESKRLTGIALDTAGNVWVCGYDTPLPPSPEPTGFAARLDRSGNLTRTVPIEGSPTGIAIEPAGSVYVTGTANGLFRGTLNAWKTDPGPARCTTAAACADAFVVKLAADGSGVLYATLVGGTESEAAYDVAAGPDGSAYVVGETNSDDFPVTPGAAQSRHGGAITTGNSTYGDGFLVRLSPDGTRPVYSTYAGGTGGERLYAVAVDKNGNAIVAGLAAASTPTHLEAVVARFDASGGLLKQIQHGGPDRPGIATGVATWDGRLFVSLLHAGVLELEPVSLQTLRIARPLLNGAAGLAVGANGRVHAVTVGVDRRTNIFAVEPGKTHAGGAYVSEFDFDQTSRPSVSAIVNAASHGQGRDFGGGDISVAPNEIITIFGRQFDDRPQVLLGGRSLAILFASPTQINAVIPNDVPLGTLPISVQIGSDVLGPWTTEVAAAVPALFALQPAKESEDYGPFAAAINEDGTINSRAHPARSGSVVALYGTGFGSLMDEAPLRA
jgi:hypothetical protein